MFSTTVTETGQITIPDKIRDHLKLVSGSRAEFVIDEDGQVKIFPLNSAAFELKVALLLIKLCSDINRGKPIFLTI